MTLKLEDLEICSLIRSPFDGNVSRRDGNWIYQHCHLPRERRNSDKDYTANGRFITEAQAQEYIELKNEKEKSHDRI